MTANPDEKVAVAQGSRILAAQGVLDAFGHVSCRSTARPDRFLISRNLAPGMVTPDDVVELDLAGDEVERSDTRLFLERFIHAEIYRLRSDVHAIVHSHAPPVLPFTVVLGATVRPICHMCGFLRDIAAPFDVADHAGPATDLLIRNAELGRELAKHLAGSSVVLMRAHGFTAVGANVPEAVYRAIYTMRNCEIELAARGRGTPSYLSDEEAVACENTIRPQIGRAWDLWLDDCPAFHRSGDACEPE